MVRRAVYGDCGTTRVLEHRRAVGVKLGFDRIAEPRLAVFRAENQMNENG
mgnify:CR=1 FL=1